MAEPTAIYEVRVSGLWNSVHRLSSAGQLLGVLRLHRNAWGTVVSGTYSPEQGEVLQMRRDPGLLRSQFSLWTDAKEWLGSSLRWHFMRREIVLHTGSRPLRLLPLSGFRRGWTIQAPRTGEMARILFRPFSAPRIEVYRKLEFELAVFSYFLGYQVRWESLWPGPLVDEDLSTATTPKKTVPSGPS